MKYLALIAVVAALAFGQPYRCDWSVNGIGGGDMSSSAYRCGATAGQTAVGQMTGTSYLAFIGFWQIDAPVGIREETRGQAALPLVTRLYAPAPNPSRGRLTIRYSLSAQAQTHVELVDLSGRIARTLVNSSQKPGRYSLRWDGRDNSGRLLANGVYFCRFRAGDYRETRKVLFAR
jgi:hypothetical protein